MHNNEEIEICFLKDFPSLLEGILFLTDLSKNQIKKFNLSKKYLNKSVEGKRSYRLPLDLVNHNKINPEYTGADVKVLFENDEVIAFSKPAKVHSHPLKYSDTNNLLSFIRASKFSSHLNINRNGYDRGLLYRLDYETSGLLIYCKSEELYQRARKDLKSIVVSKCYLAVVSGYFNCNGSYTHYIKPVGKNGARMELTTSEDLKGRKVDCSFSILEYQAEKNISLVQVDLDQGERHQIRKQLEAVGYSIIGDPLYGEQAGQRMYLHCWNYNLSLGKLLNLKDNHYELFFDLFDFNS